PSPVPRTGRPGRNRAAGCPARAAPPRAGPTSLTRPPPPSPASPSSRRQAGRPTDGEAGALDRPLRIDGAGAPGACGARQGRADPAAGGVLPRAEEGALGRLHDRQAQPAQAFGLASPEAAVAVAGEGVHATGAARLTVVVRHAHSFAPCRARRAW